MSHFSLAELVRSDHPELQDEPSTAAQVNLARLVADLAEPARAILGVALRVNSGYRGVALNAAVGGSPTSAHCLGLAIDVVPEGLDIVEAFERLRVSDGRSRALVVDQAIFESKGARGGQTRWIHLGLAPKGKEPRNQWLACTPATGGHYVPYSREATA